MFNHVLIIGLGLMGSSLARAIRRHKLAEVITGNDVVERNMRKASEAGLIDKEAKSITEAASEADLIIICAPLGAYQNIARSIAKFPKLNCIITDIGSVKGHVIENFHSLLSSEQQRNFVPSHPITGSEKSGLDAAAGDIYKNRMAIVSPLNDTSKDSAASIVRFWERIGCNVTVMDCDRHDEIFAAVSHIPQLLCYAFSDAMAKSKVEIRSPDENFLKFIRLGASDAVIWQDIFLLNQKNICRSLTPYYLNLSEFIKNLENGNREALNGWFTTGSVVRKAIKDGVEYKESELDDSPQCGLQLILPRIISAVYLNIMPPEFLTFTGPGFLDFTRIAITENPVQTVEYAIQKKGDIIFLLNTFFDCFDSYYKTIERDTKSDVFHKISESREHHQSALRGKIPH